MADLHEQLCVLESPFQGSCGEGLKEGWLEAGSQELPSSREGKMVTKTRALTRKWSERGRSPRLGGLRPTTESRSDGMRRRSKPGVGGLLA